MTEPTEFHRPALVKLRNDLQEMREELLEGFDSRRAVLDWEQRLIIRTIGELPQAWYHDLARQFRGALESERERTLLAAMLQESVRRRDLDEGAARALRERLAAITIMPAYHRAVRQLRSDVTEYVDNDDESGDWSSGASKHDPNVQRYVAMRPAIDELERNQRAVLSDILEGFDDRGDILEWGDDVELATHAEVREGFTTRCYQEDSTAQILLGTDQSAARARELFAAHYLMPAFNAGVRDLSGRAGEEAYEDTEPTDDEPPDW